MENEGKTQETQLVGSIGMEGVEGAERSAKQKQTVNTKHNVNVGRADLSGQDEINQ